MQFIYTVYTNSEGVICEGGGNNPILPAQNVTIAAHFNFLNIAQEIRQYITQNWHFREGFLIPSPRIALNRFFREIF